MYNSCLAEVKYVKLQKLALIILWVEFAWKELRKSYLKLFNVPKNYNRSYTLNSGEQTTAVFGVSSPSSAVRVQGFERLGI